MLSLSGCFLKTHFHCGSRWLCIIFSYFSTSRDAEATFMVPLIWLVTAGCTCWFTGDSISAGAWSISGFLVFGFQCWLQVKTSCCFLWKFNRRQITVWAPSKCKVHIALVWENQNQNVLSQQRLRETQWRNRTSWKLLSVKVSTGNLILE